MSPRHCQLHWAEGFWRVRDLASSQGTHLNDVLIESERALFTGDELVLGTTRLKYVTDEPDDDSIWRSRLASADAAPGWSAWADALQERGDPLGERIARFQLGGAVDHLPWLGALREVFISGQLEINWAFGFIQSATLRPVAGRLALDWRFCVSTLFHLRVGRLLRSLTVDIALLEQPLTQALAQRLHAAQQFFIRAPHLPQSLELLSLGYELGAPFQLQADSELQTRLPQLQSPILFRRTEHAHLRLLSSAPGVQLSGIEHVRALTDITRLRKEGTRHLLIESPPGLPLLTAGNPCFFSITEGRVRLTSGQLQGEIRVNGRVDASFDLLPGDVIELVGMAALRFDTL